MLPRLSLRERGFRRVRGQVRKRISRRLSALSLSDLGAYERFIDGHPEELVELDGMCRITISRFCRDREIWTALRQRVFPELAARARTAGRGNLRALSAGCASGEEPYTLSLLWEFSRPTDCHGLSLLVDAVDADLDLLERARRGCYPRGTLRELDSRCIEQAFEPIDGELRLRERYRARVRFLCQDVREGVPAGPYDLAFARNLPFTYFSEPLQCRVLADLHGRLRPQGALVIGAHERLPDTQLFRPWSDLRAIFVRC